LLFNNIKDEGKQKRYTLVTTILKYTVNHSDFRVTYNRRIIVRRR